jgi:predicted nuclease of predicted toxin-antitoxin system
LRFLLDENLPLQLHRRLVAAGLQSEHIITSGQRGLPDVAIKPGSPSKATWSS